MLSIDIFGTKHEVSLASNRWVFHAKYFAYSIHHQLHGTVHGVNSHEHRSLSLNTGAQSSWDLISDVIPSSRAMQRLTRGFASYLATRDYIVTWKLYLFWRIAMELRIYFLRKLTFIKNQTFLRKFSTTKIWSYTVIDYSHISHYINASLWWNI